MRSYSSLPTFLVLLGLVLGWGCNRSSQPSGSSDSNASSGGTDSNRFPIEGEKYTILNILTDGGDNSRAKSHVESTLLQYPDIGCMVGLWSANAPMILAGLQSSGRTGEVHVIGFDEHPDTLQGIEDGLVHGTIVQQPYAFGFRSVEFLSAIARGGSVDLPESGRIYIPYREIRADNVQQFQAEIQAMQSGDGPILDPMAEPGDRSQDVSVAFITNGPDPFWLLAEKGCERAAEHFDAEVAYQAPSESTIEGQKRLLETDVVRGVDGIAISPIDPANQVSMINDAAAEVPVICHDSDAPDSDRLFYLGTSNYMAGRAAGRLIKEAMPEGGSVMMFVGLIEVLNAQERSQGVIDELNDTPIPEEYQDAAE